MAKFTNYIKGIIRQRVVRILSLLAILSCFYGFLTKDNIDNKVADAVNRYYSNYLDSLDLRLIVFDDLLTSKKRDRLREQFRSARSAFKKIEFIVEYHYPTTALKINGPALLEAEASEPNEPQHPSGFQVLEEYVFDEDSLDVSMITYELSNIRNRVSRLKNTLPELELTESNILDALRLNITRLITKGITGFDSPVALNSIEEAHQTLISLKDVIRYFGDTKLLRNDVQDAIDFLRIGNYDFNKFNRARFISRYINSISNSLYEYQVYKRIPFVRDKRAIKFNARTIFDRGAFDVLFYAPSGTEAATLKQITLGKQLFAEPMLSSTGQRSCKTCHDPAKAFTDGLALNESLNASTKLLRNTPTLINSALQAALFYDSHIAFLEDQAHDVISSRQEMGGSFEDITARLTRHKTYKSVFAMAYKDRKVSPENIKSALAAYVRSLVAMNSRFDQYMRGNVKAMSNVEIEGFNLFMGKAKCGTCHFMPLFSGNVPPLYDKMESEVLGVPANTDTANAIMEMDSGKYQLYKIPHQLFSFKTPSVRNAGLTAPYMHNGVYKTLEEVIDFYDRGGGAGIGIKLDNQTLPAERLNLSKEEKIELIAFINCLTDRVMK